MLFESCCTESNCIVDPSKCFRDAESHSAPIDIAHAGGPRRFAKREKPVDELTGLQGMMDLDSIVDIDIGICQEENLEIERMLSLAKLRGLAVADLGLLGSGVLFPEAPAVTKHEDSDAPLIPTVTNLDNLPKNFAGDALLEFGVLWRCHRTPHRTLESDYLMTSRELGSCRNGKVRLATSKHGLKQSVAVKTYRLKGLSAMERKRLRSEAHISLCVDHPNVARLHDVYESDSQMNLVMELVGGGSLATRLADIGTFAEREAVFIIRQILSALCYLHSHGIAHRDLKPENILYSIPGGNHVKLIDFGLSEDVSENWLMFDGCGTLLYVAPEVLHQRCTAQSDLWSLGVIAYVLLSGHRPFRGSDVQVMAKIKRGSYEFAGECWKTLSPHAKTFIQALMEIDPSKRLSARKAMRHDWISTVARMCVAKVDSGIIKSLRSWSTAPKVQQICRSLIAWRFAEKDQTKLRDSFLALDTDFDGTISVDELRAALLNIQTADAEAQEVFRALGKEKIRYTDFLAAMIPGYIKADSELIDAAFARFDAISSNGVSSSEVQQILCDVFIDSRNDGDSDVDNKDDAINREELVNFMRSLKDSGGSAFPQCQEGTIKMLWHL